MNSVKKISAGIFFDGIMDTLPSATYPVRLELGVPDGDGNIKQELQQATNQQSFKGRRKKTNFLQTCPQRGEGSTVCQQSIEKL